MYITIEFDSETPIYEQLRRQIIIGIAKGELNPGEKLPSIRQLAEEIGINLHTVNKAYNLLKDEGYLIIDRRVGAMVSYDFQNESKDFNEKLKDEMEYLLADSKNRGLSLEEFIELSKKIYSEYEEEKK